MYIDEDGDFCSFDVRDLMERCGVCDRPMIDHNEFCEDRDVLEQLKRIAEEDE
jgi:hypothetical protein